MGDEQRAYWLYLESFNRIKEVCFYKARLDRFKLGIYFFHFDFRCNQRAKLKALIHKIKLKTQAKVVRCLQLNRI